MNTFFSQLKKDAEDIRLSAREREDMRRALENAIQNGGLVESPIRVHPSPYLFMHQRLVSGMAFILVVAFVGGGTTYAAEGALPGDALYAVKLNVNESLRAALAQSAEAKAEWHAEAVYRRMAEAEILAARGDLTPEAQVVLEENFEENTEALEAHIAIVEEEDPVVAADISNRFESSLIAHSAVVARLGGRGESDVNRRESERFAQKLRDRGERMALAARSAPKAVEAADTAEVSLMAVAQAPEEPVIETATFAARSVADDAVIVRLEMRASTTLDEAEAYLEELEVGLDATTSARVRGQIGKLRETIERFKKEREAGFSEKARVQQLLRDVSTMKAFLEAQSKFKGHLLLPAPGVPENGEDESEDREVEVDTPSDLLPAGGPGSLVL